MGKCFDRIIVVMLENALRANVLENPYMAELRKKGVFLENAYGVTHSSQPNYIASIGGDTFGLFDDTPGYAQWIYETGQPGVPPVTCVVDLMEEAGVTWKAYAEDLQEANKPLTSLNPTEAPPADVFPFARKHVPFLSFPVITSNPKRLENIVNAQDEFNNDLANGTLPQYSWYTPNLINDGHSLSTTQQRIDPKDTNRSTNVENIATFLQSFLGDDPVKKFPPKTLIAVTFDEAYPYYDPYQIYTLLIGDMLEAGTSRCEPYNHYNLLRTVEENFSLGTLQRNDAVATPYWFMK